MKPTQLIGPLVLALALLPATLASADTGIGSATSGMASSFAPLDYGPPAVPSPDEIDRLLRDQSDPQWSKEVRVAWFDPRPGMPGCHEDCGACSHFDNCVRECEYPRENGDSACASCQSLLAQCRENNNC